MNHYQQVLLWIPGPLPGMNEIIAAAKQRGHRYALAKRTWTNAVMLKCRAIKIPTFRSITIGFTWIEASKRRNPDNIAAGKKFIIDGLVKAGVIENDGWSEIEGWTDSFLMGERPGVHVAIYGELRK